MSLALGMLFLGVGWMVAFAVLDWLVDDVALRAYDWWKRKKKQRRKL